MGACRGCFRGGGGEAEGLRGRRLEGCDVGKGVRDN